MLNNINSAMINRIIAGGGLMCKCTGGNNGGSGNGVNGGKITVEFPVYTIEETIEEISGEPPTTTTTTTSKEYILKEDANKAFSALLKVNLEKYVSYLCTLQEEPAEGIRNCFTFPCACGEIKQIDDDNNVRIIFINSGETETSAPVNITIQITNDDIIFDNSAIQDSSIVDTIDGTPVSVTTQKFTFYYMER
jgi:uncharacterized protein YlzI (FlbEa/FlbD family)